MQRKLEVGELLIYPTCLRQAAMVLTLFVTEISDNEGILSKHLQGPIIKQKASQFDLELDTK